MRGNSLGLPGEVSFLLPHYFLIPIPEKNHNFSPFPASFSPSSVASLQVGWGDLLGPQETLVLPFIIFKSQPLTVFLGSFFPTDYFASLPLLLCHFSSLTSLI